MQAETRAFPMLANPGSAPNITCAHTLAPSQGHGWRIERDYLELKQEVGLDHYEGRGWRGFHHHASLCIAALRIPDLRDGGPRTCSGDSPLRTSPRLARLAICRSRRLSTQRCCRCARSARCPTQSPRCVSASHAPWCAHCHGVPAAGKCASDRSGRLNDTVGLGDEARIEMGEVREAARTGLTDIEAGRYTLVATPEDDQRLDERMMARLRKRLAN